MVLRNNGAHNQNGIKWPMMLTLWLLVRMAICNVAHIHSPPAPVFIRSSNACFIRSLRTSLRTSRPNVIHSFWVPAPGSKMDTIPGRTNVSRLTPAAPALCGI